MKLQHLFLVITLLFVNRSSAQIENSTKSIQKKFEGNWYNKSTNRYIKIYFEKEVDYATINDWTGKNSTANIDSYKAYIKAGKLILYAENEDHHAPYCELKIIGNYLVCECNQGLNFKDQFLNTKKTVNKTVFIKLKGKK